MALGTKQYFCPQGHLLLLEEQKATRLPYACAECKEHIDSDYYYCKTDNEVYHKRCVDVEVIDNNASTASRFMARAKGWEPVDEQ